MTSDGCTAGDPGNLEKNKHVHFKMNPSSNAWGAISNYYKASEQITFPFGTFDLVQLEDKWRLQFNQCYVDHVYSCTHEKFIVKYKDSLGDACSDDGVSPNPGSVPQKSPRKV